MYGGAPGQRPWRRSHAIGRNLLLIVRWSPALLATLAPRALAAPAALQSLACDGVRDDRAALQAQLDANPGGVVELPARCRALLSNPGSDRAALVLRAGVTLRCRGSDSGLVLESRTCSAGRYAGAACTTDDDCDFCGEACRGATCRGRPFAASAEGNVTILAEDGPDPTVEGCTIEVRQHDPYRRCEGGPRSGKPCLQVCEPAPDRPPLVPRGLVVCETNVQCEAVYGSGATCRHREDCAQAGGRCTAAPGSPAGPGGIRAVDFARVRSILRNLRIVDHGRGDVGVAVGPGSEVVGLNGTLTSPARMVAPAAPAGVAVGLRVTGGTVTDSTFSGGQVALHAVSSLGSVGNRLERNVVPPQPASAMGILLQGSGNHAAHNNLRGCTHACVVIEGDGSSISTSTIRPAEGATGIVVSGMANLVEGNSVRAASTLQGTVGILVSSRGEGSIQHRIVHNNLSDLDHGIQVEHEAFNVTVANNRLFSFGNARAAITITGAGFQLVGNYLNWMTTGPRRCGATCAKANATCAEDTDCGGCTNTRHQCEVDPIVWLGTANASQPAAVAHPVIANNLFSTQPGATAIRVAHIGGRCVVEDKTASRCRVATDCEAGVACWVPGLIEDVLLADNSFINDGLMLDLSDIDDASTMVRNWIVRGNLHQGKAARSSIAFPVTPASAMNLQIRDNLLTSAEPLVGWDWRMGVVGDNGTPGPADDAVDLVHLVNRTGATGRSFAAVAIDPIRETSFAYATRSSASPIGILLDAPADGARGKVAIRGTTTCAVGESAVQAGNRLAPSSEAGVLEPTSDEDRAILALALSAKAGGQGGLVRCLVQPTSR